MADGFTIEIDEDLARTIEQRAKEAGMSREDYVRFALVQQSFRYEDYTWTGDDPRTVRFAYGPQGKPRLVDARGLTFNLTHSGGLALIAIARGRRVGIDLERIREIAESDQIANSFFSRRERDDIRDRETPELRTRAFLACWTRKEAYIKARGAGLSFPLHALEVPANAGEPSVLLEHDPDVRWSLLDLFVDTNHIAALAAEGGDCRVSWYV